jgi:hypothetical protein
MNQYSMIAFIVLVVMVTSLIRSSLAIKQRRGGQGAVGDDAAAGRLEAEVRQLKERLAVLERITIEKENSLEREIESLRDRP